MERVLARWPTAVILDVRDHLLLQRRASAPTERAWRWNRIHDDHEKVVARKAVRDGGNVSEAFLQPQRTLVRHGGGGVPEESTKQKLK